MGYAIYLLIFSILLSITTATAQAADVLSAVQGASAPPAYKAQNDREVSLEPPREPGPSIDKKNGLSVQSQQNVDEPSKEFQAKKKRSKKKKLKHKHLPADAAFTPSPSRNLIQQKSGEADKGSQKHSTESSLLSDKRKPEEISADEVHQRIEAATTNAPKVTKVKKQSFYVYRSPEIDAKTSHPPKPPVNSALRGLKPQGNPQIAKPKPPPVDEIASFTSEMNLAELGDSEAQLHVGMKLYQGKGALQDRRKGFAWILKAAEKGKFSPESLNILGRAYFNGIDIGKDYFEAKKWLSLSADQDNYTAKNDLAYMLYNGLGGDKDYVKAFELYQQISKHGDVLAQANLGTMYATGTGTAIDKARAYAWYTFAANQGNALAAENRNELLLVLSWEELNLAQKISIELYHEFESREAENPTVHKGQFEHAEPVKNSF